MSEKYLKKLIGKTEIEDALKRLDKLTNEEVRMVTARVLEATHTVDDKVGRVEDKVGRVEDNVLEATHTVDDKVGRVEDKVERVAEGKVLEAMMLSKIKYSMSTISWPASTTGWLVLITM